jgi:hypothetical protein
MALRPSKSWGLADQSTHESFKSMNDIFCAIGPVHQLASSPAGDWSVLMNDSGMRTREAEFAFNRQEEAIFRRVCFRTGFRFLAVVQMT